MTKIMKPKLSLILGILGMLLCIYSNLLTSGSLLQKTNYFISSSLLMSAALLERQMFFIILQIVILGGTIAAFMPFGPGIKAILPIALSIAGLSYLVKLGSLKEFYAIAGCIGLVLLAAGYAVSNPFIYFFGGLLLSYYSFVSYHRGVSIALLWAILNAFFTVTAAIGIYHLLSSGDYIYFKAVLDCHGPQRTRASQ
ncbi:MAG: hypothetical protein AB7F64_07370 [Gammaproteobacteria bacterium]